MSDKLVNECLFCKNRFCYTRVVSIDMSYDEVACKKHVLELYSHSDQKAPGVVKHFIQSTGVLKRGIPFNTEP